MTLAHAAYKSWTGEYLFAVGSPPFVVMRIYVEFFLQHFGSCAPKSFNDLDPPVQAILVFVPNLAVMTLGILSLLALLRSPRPKNAVSD